MSQLTCFSLFIPIFTLTLFSQVFTPVSQDFYNVAYSSSEWADYNNDGYLDLLLVGIDGSDISRSSIFKNNGNGTFTELSFALQNDYIGSVAWGDFDNDNYPDILMTGYTGSQNFTKIYKNNAGTSFTELSISLPSVHVSSVEWADFNKDGFDDFVLTGWTGSQAISKIYKSNGDGTFIAQEAISIVNVFSGTATWCDYNNDSNIDLLVCGATENVGFSSPVTRIYKNNNNGTFTEINPGITGLCGTTGGKSAARGDYDKDGLADIVIAGSDGNGNPVSKIYKNTGNDTFVEQTGIQLPAVTNSALGWADYNNDGYLDLLISGSTGNSCVTQLFRNNKNGTFTDMSAGEPFPMVWMGSVSWGDFNNDGKVDVFLSGQSDMSGAGGRSSKIYRNDLPVSIGEENKTTLGSFILYQNYPNPFNPVTVINYHLTSAGNVTLQLFNIDGKEITVLKDGFTGEGNHSLMLETGELNLSSGVYLYRLTFADRSGKIFTDSKKLLLLR